MAGHTERKSSSRILTFDLLRGYFMISIILNHLQWYPNGLDWVAMRGTLLVSAAEGFFLISGIVLGIVRGRKLLDKPFREAAALLIKRGLLLYVVSVILALAFTFIGWWFFMDNPGLKDGIRPPDQPLGEVILGILSFRYLYGWADFLRLYSIFLLIAPLALWLLRRGKWYLVLAGSIGLWAIFPFIDQNDGLLMPLSWQLIFFSGFVIGFHWNDLTAKWKALRSSIRQPLLYITLAAATLTLALDLAICVLTTLHMLPTPIEDWYSTMRVLYFDKEALPLPRLIIFGLWFILGFYVFSRFESQIRRFAGWLLMPFGLNSLYAYILHAVLLFFAHLIIAPGTSKNIIVNAIGSVIILGIIYIAIKKRFLFTIIPR